MEILTITVSGFFYFVFILRMANNLIVSIVKYRGYLFTANPAMMEPTETFGFFSLKEFDWFHVETKTSINKYAFRHGSKVGATSNGIRTFNLTFTTFASDELERLKLIRLVSSIFNPPSLMSDTEGFHDLDFMTPDGVRRTAKAQVTTRPKVFDYNNSNRATFQVELVGQEGSLLLSKHQTVHHDTNTIPGFTLPTTRPRPLSYTEEIIDYKGTSDTPFDITITARQTVTLPWIYIRTMNGDDLLTTMELAEITLQQGDQLIINSYEETIHHQTATSRNEISNQLSLNSERPRLLSPVSSQGVQAVVDCGMIEEVLDVEYRYYEVWD